MEAPTQARDERGGNVGASESLRVARREQLARAPSAISVRELEKTFRIPKTSRATLKERVLHPFERIPKLEVPAARGISFEVKRGEFFGIVGRNGSGKSTLLKLLAGIYRPDSGVVEVRGRVSPFIELGVGFNQEMVARDNVLINGTMLGLSRAETLRRFDSIVEFAGLEEFTELKLKNYSSGMLVRLAFSTAIQVDADVLLLDEVLAVGDAAFQEKCFEAFRRMKRDGRTIVLVTHSMEHVKRFCDRAIMLEKGTVVTDGDPEEVGERYREAAALESEEVLAQPTDSTRFGDRAASVLEAWVEDSAGERHATVRQGEPIALCALVEFNEPMSDPVLGIQLDREAGDIAFASNTLWADVASPDFAAGERATLRIELENNLGLGTYTITPGVAHRDGSRSADIRYGFASFAVRGERWTGAAADLPHEISVSKT